ncbi:hypothetical protein BT69DRAFT_1291944 [Atractiella rhizophila]|nr:hypothetical protein BT69DRAFT_1291944 [Atractiella rhizophila]
MGQGHDTRPAYRTLPTPINGQFRLRGYDDNAIMGSLPLAQILQLTLTYAAGRPIATAVRALTIEDANKNLISRTIQTRLTNVGTISTSFKFAQKTKVDYMNGQRDQMSSHDPLLTLIEVLSFQPHF